MTDPRAQEQYQVRFASGPRGMRELAGADVLLIADELGEGGISADELGEGGISADELGGADAVRIASAQDAARRILAEQERRGSRVSVGVVARGAADASVPVPDLLAAGAVIDALAELGLDHCSPEAAVAAAAYTGLRRATTHLVRASVAARIRESDASGARSL